MFISSVTPTKVSKRHDSASEGRWNSCSKKSSLFIGVKSNFIEIPFDTVETFLVISTYDMITWIIVIIEGANQREKIKLGFL